MLLPLEYHFPRKQLAPHQLDKLLASGYFRTGSYLTRNRVLLFDNQILNTLHLRVNLDNYRPSKSMEKLLRKNNQLFTISIRPMCIDEEKEKLYAQNRQRFKGNASPSITNYLYDTFKIPVFNTTEINIYHNGKLVGYSLFDAGQNSIASIIGIFDQAYSKYSLGIYTMLLEMEYGKEHGFKYYYPGYVANEPSQFNYKLRIGEVDYYDWLTKRWVSFRQSNKRKMVNDVYKEKLEEAKQWLDQLGLKYKQMLYPYFYLGGMYPESDCVKGLHHLLIEDFERKGLYYIIEFHPTLLQIIFTGVTLHKYQYEDEINFDAIFEGNRWQRVLLYLHPYVSVQNAQDLKLAYLFLQKLFKQDEQSGITYHS